MMFVFHDFYLPHGALELSRDGRAPVMLMVFSCFITSVCKINVLGCGNTLGIPHGRVLVAMLVHVPGIPVNLAVLGMLCRFMKHVCLAFLAPAQDFMCRNACAGTVPGWIFRVLFTLAFSFCSCPASRAFLLETRRFPRAGRWMPRVSLAILHVRRSVVAGFDRCWWFHGNFHFRFLDTNHTINAATNDDSPMTTMKSIKPSDSVNGDPAGICKYMTGKTLACSPIHWNTIQINKSSTIVMRTVPALKLLCFPPMI
jgi:hypothetical protein